MARAGRQAPERFAKVRVLFGGSDGVPHTLFFDGTAAGGVSNLRNFATTRFSLNDSSIILFRADY